MVSRFESHLFERPDQFPMPGLYLLAPQFRREHHSALHAYVAVAPDYIDLTVGRFHRTRRHLFEEARDFHHNELGHVRLDDEIHHELLKTSQKPGRLEEHAGRQDDGFGLRAVDRLDFFF